MLAITEISALTITLIVIFAVLMVKAHNYNKKEK